MTPPCRATNGSPGPAAARVEGLNRIHAIFGWSEKCVATYPGDMANALYALDAVVRVRGANGRERTIPIDDFHRLPGDTPQKDTNLRARRADRGHRAAASRASRRTAYYLKVRDRASYAFALVAVAAALELDGGHDPAGARRARRRRAQAVAEPRGRSGARRQAARREETFRRAAEAALKEAKPLAHNAYKVELGKRAIVRALMRAGQLA